MDVTRGVVSVNEEWVWWIAMGRGEGGRGRATSCAILAM